MMNNYKRLFEQISPKESDEMLIGRLRARKAENMKENKTPKHIFLRKAVAIPAAAVLAVGAVTVSVGAAVNWDYAKAFKGMFARQYEGNVNVNSTVQTIPVESSAPDNTSTDTARADNTSETTPAETELVEYTPEKPIGTFDFEKYGKQLGIVMEGDGITATLDGMLVYDDLCYIMYTTTASDELLEKTGGEVPGLRIDFGNFDFKIDGKVAGGMGYSTDTISEEGNTRTGCIEIHYDSVDLAGKTLNIGFLSETDPGDPSTAVIKQHIDIPIDFKLSENIEKELDFELKTDSFDGTINKIKVSGFKSTLYYSGISNEPEPSISCEPTYDETNNDGVVLYKVPEDSWAVNEDSLAEISKYPGDILDDEIGAYGDAIITLKDGTTVVAKNSGGRQHSKGGELTGEIELRYTYPIDPADVSSIKFGDYTINL